MAVPDTAKPATAIAVNGLRIVEQLGGQLDLENTPSIDGSQAETALSAALREALARRGVSR
jgi:hypothetical protein